MEHNRTEPKMTKMKEMVVYVCSFCKDSFNSNDDITCHLLNSHDDNKTIQKLKKKLNPKKKVNNLRSKENVKRNKKICDQECKVRKYGREFYCDICNYKTVYKSTYQRHLLTHEKDGRQHKCEYCSYAAVQSNNLKIHLENVHPFGAVEPVVISQ